MAVLIKTRGLNSSEVFQLEGEQSILGRQADCDIYVNDSRVSRQHARVLQRDGDFLIEDLDSRNGTYVNGERIHDAHCLADADSIVIGDDEFTFFIEPPTGTDSKRSPPSTKAASSATIADLGESSVVVSTAKVSSSLASLDNWDTNPERKLAALIEMLSNLGSALDLNGLLENLLDGLFKVFPAADRAFVGLWDEQAERVVPRATRQRGFQTDDRIVVSRTLVDQAMNQKEAVLSTDVSTDSRFEASQSLQATSVRSLMCVPLVDAEDKALGIIQLDTANQSNQFDKQDLDVLAAVAPQAATAVRYSQLHEETVHREILDRDLELARRVQRALLPDMPPEIDGYGFFSFYDSAYQVGGDFFDYVSLSGGREAVIVADVSGKGVAASLMMAKMSGEFKYLLSSSDSISAAVARMNDAICNQGVAGRFITLVVAVVDPASHQVTIVNAGHLTPLHRRTDGTVELIGEEQRGAALGILEDEEYDECQCTLRPGESLSLFTDGFTEAMNASEELYGEQRIISVMQNDASNPTELGKVLLEDVKGFVGDTAQSDDMCLICLGRIEDQLTRL